MKYSLINGVWSAVAGAVPGLKDRSSKTSPMRACLQRVTRAQVTVAGEVCGKIERGLLILLGVVQGDEDADARELARKIVSLRVFDDAQGKMNLSVADVGGAVLVVSQFTLAGDCRKGRRPSFDAAAGPEIAERLYEVFVRAVGEQGIAASTGRFSPICWSSW